MNKCCERKLRFANAKENRIKLLAAQVATMINGGFSVKDIDAVINAGSTKIYLLKKYKFRNAQERILLACKCGGINKKIILEKQKQIILEKKIIAKIKTLLLPFEKPKQGYKRLKKIAPEKYKIIFNKNIKPLLKNHTKISYFYQTIGVDINNSRHRYLCKTSRVKKNKATKKEPVALEQIIVYTEPKEVKNKIETSKN